MKKALIAGIVGLGLVAATQSFGQGYTEFDNYASNPYMPVTYGSTHGGLSGHSVTNGSYHVDLLYQIGTASSTSTMTDAGLNVAINPNLQALGSTGGYFQGGEFTVPGYVSGPVSFAVEAWLTSGPNSGATYAASNDKGISAIWQEASLPTGLSAPAYWSGLPGPNGASLLAVNIVPEPSILALSGIGAAALMLIRRKK